MARVVEKKRLSGGYSLPIEPRARLKIGVLSEHPIVTDYISRAFHENRKHKIAITEISEWSTTLDDPGPKPQIFIIDRSSLQWRAGEYVRMIKAALPAAKVLVLDRPLPDKDLCRLIYLGGDGFISYSRLTHDLPQAVKALSLGRLWFPSQALEKFVSYVKEIMQQAKKRPAFTTQERSILGLLQQRLSNKEISNKLGIEECTVKFHLRNIFDKLGVRDRHAVVDQIKMKTEFFGPGRLDIFTSGSDYQPVQPNSYGK